MSLPVVATETQEIRNRSKSMELGHQGTTAQTQASSVSIGSHDETQSSKTFTKTIETSPNTTS